MSFCGRGLAGATFAEVAVMLACNFSWLAQHLVKLECHFSWQAHHFGKFWGRAGATECVAKMGGVSSPKMTDQARMFVGSKGPGGMANNFVLRFMGLRFRHAM